MLTIEDKLNDGNPIRPTMENKCCKKPNIIQNNGYNVCANCGMVYSSIIEKKSRVAFSNDEKKDRQINERVYYPIGTRTLIKGNKDAKGCYLNPHAKSNFKRLAKINSGYINGYERNLSTALKIYHRLKFLLNLPEHVAEEAYKIYNYAAKQKITRGRSIEALISASIYCAVRINNIPIIIDKILINTDITKKEFLNSFKVLNREVLPYLKLKIKIINPINYVDKFTKQLNLSMRCRFYAVDLIKNCKKHGLILSGKDPKGIAAASLYLSAKICDEPRKQKEICKFAHISEVTMRSRMYELKNHLPN